MSGIGRIDTLGLPVIKPDQVLVGGGKGVGNLVTVQRLIFQSIITTFIFLIVVVWFTILLNISTRETNETDYFLFQFAVYFTIFSIILIMFLIVIILSE
jgi:hypothetical protein